ncbi:MAG: undecaprenyldiphospho-muramoylpentapeptide beta-N-acetylglucosaminyltransferase [Balneolaceae bacterium]
MTVSVKNISSTNTPTAALSPIRVLMAAGGTGGHVYPAVAIADAVKRNAPDAKILFAGTRDRMEWQAVPKAGYEIKSVWISGFHRRLTAQNLLFPFKLITSLFQSFKILRSFKPDIVVACGGFAAGPIGWTAAKLNIPVVIQEQNSFPGVTNRMLAKYAAAIFTAFDEAKKFFPEEKVKLEGNPVRSQLEKSDRKSSLEAFNFTANAPVLLILGGSGGAKALNDIMSRELPRLHNELGLQVIWQCGERYLDDLRQDIDLKKYSRLRLMSFIDDMPAAYGAADLVVTRAGASTCSELMMAGQPAVLVPSPNVAGDHQKKNAASMVAANAAKLLEENKLKDSFLNTIRELIYDKDELKRMSSAMKQLARPDAASAIAKEIFTIADKRK